jgi:ketosteroid isomerase-like protein
MSNVSHLESLVRKYYEAFNARSFDAYAELFAADCVTEAPGFSARGVEGVRVFDRGWQEAFPKARIESMRMTTADDTVVTGNWFHAGKHEGTLRTPAGDLPPTGKEFEAPYLSRFEVADGKIRLQRLIFEPDFVPLKLGVR